MNNDISLDDQLKKLQIEKIRNEIESASYSFWMEILKLIGGLIVGSISAFIAYDQYMDAQVAKRGESAAKQEEKVAKNTLQEVKVEKDELKESIETQKNRPEIARARLVYVQFQGSTTREFINELRTSLQAASFNAPGAERVHMPEYNSMVKVFTPPSGSVVPEDKADAERLANSVETFFQAKGCRVKLPVVYVSASKESPLEV